MVSVHPVFPRVAPRFIVGARFIVGYSYPVLCRHEGPIYRPLQMHRYISQRRAPIHRALSLPLYTIIT